MDEHSESLMSSDTRDSIPLRPFGRAFNRHTFRRDPSYSLASPGEDNGHGCPAESSSSFGAPSKAGATSTVQPDEYLPVRPISRRPHFLLNWWQEMAACVTFVVALLALFGTLYEYQDKPSPDWPNWLSLNTIVAIYVVLLKTGITLVTAEGIGQLKWSWFAKERPLADLVKYDDASRGPFGAFALLWRLKLSHVLSSLGALVIVLSLAVDPFAQQILRYYDCSIPVAGAPATLPRTNFYVEVGGLHTGALQTSIVPGVQAAINAGIFNPSSSPSAECSTGNCTWASDYSSLAWCSACEDISEQLTIANRTGHKWDPYLNRTERVTNLTTSLPRGGLSVNMTYDSGGQEYAAMGASPYGAFEAGYTPADTDIDFILAQDIVGNVDPSTGEAFPDCNNTAANQTWKCKGYGASRCRLYPCVKSYAASVNAGKLTETLLATGHNWGFNSTYLTVSMLDTKCINDAERTSLEKLRYAFNSDERWLDYNVTFSLYETLNDTFPESMMIRNCIYGIDLVFLVSLQAYLGSLFSGTIFGPTVAPSLPLGLFSGPQALQTVFNFGDVSFDRLNESFANVSTSLTNYIRTNGKSNFSSPVVGIALQSKTCIAVRWPWLAFPATLVLLTLIFFALVVLETRPIGPRPDIWKSSPLALLYHGLSLGDGREPSTRPADDLDHLPGMRAVAKGMTVKLGSSLDDNVARLEVQNGR